MTVLESVLETPTERPAEPVIIGRGHGLSELPIPTPLALNVLSENYATYAKSGNDNVFFTIPAQEGVVAPLSADSFEDGSKDTVGDHTSVKVLMANTKGEEKLVTLRIQKKVWNTWKPINDATGAGEGQVVVFIDFADNPDFDVSQPWSASFIMDLHSFGDEKFKRPINVDVSFNSTEKAFTLGELLNHNFSINGKKSFFYIPPQSGVSTSSDINSSDDGFIGTESENVYDLISVNLLDTDNQEHTVNLRISRSVYSKRSHITDSRDSENAFLYIEYFPEDNTPVTQNKLLTGQLTLVQEEYGSKAFQSSHVVNIN